MIIKVHRKIFDSEGNILISDIMEVDRGLI